MEPRPYDSLTHSLTRNKVEGLAQEVRLIGAMLVNSRLAPLERGQMLPDLFAPEDRSLNVPKECEGHFL